MARDRIAVAILICIELLLIHTPGCSGSTSKNIELTKKYGTELRVAYENYKSAVAIAYETGNTSRLLDTATGYELNHRMETAGTENAKAVAEAWKVEVISVTVTEHLTDTAEILVNERIIGDIPDVSESDRRQAWICRLERDDGVWKVSSFEPVLDR